MAFVKFLYFAVNPISFREISRQSFFSGHHAKLSFAVKTRGTSLNSGCSRFFSSSTMESLDEEQLKLLSEQCILVDENDEFIGSATKKTCHLLDGVNPGLLHRAFSIFLFNSKQELLLQQRSDAKITFPGYWTNTCCSHPLNVAAELETSNNMGVKRAAQRKLEHELGIKAAEIPIEDFHYLTRIHYKAQSNGQWGEHEIDHILFLQKDVDLQLNYNEVQNTAFVNQNKLRTLLEKGVSGDVKITPWFRLIAERFLFNWWNSLGNLKQFEDYETIHKML